MFQNHWDRKKQSRLAGKLSVKEQPATQVSTAIDSSPDDDPILSGKAVSRQTSNVPGTYLDRYTECAGEREVS